MTDSQKRRRFLQLTGTGVAASLAGCSDLSLSGNGDGDAHLTAIAEPDADEFEELREDVESGEVPPEEAQQREMELFDEAIDQFEDRVEAEDESDLRIEERHEQGGIYLVDGSADVLVDALRTGDISVLGGEPLYSQLTEQQQQQPAPEGGEEIDEDELEEIEEEMQEGIEEQDDTEGEAADDEGGEDGDGSD
ncbi:hypothetical protein ACLI4Z_15760 [Natrialbaceae archaeon A-arb3/5]